MRDSTDKRSEDQHSFRIRKFSRSTSRSSQNSGVSERKQTIEHEDDVVVTKSAQKLSIARDDVSLKSNKPPANLKVRSDSKLIDPVREEQRKKMRAHILTLHAMFRQFTDRHEHIKNGGAKRPTSA